MTTDEERQAGRWKISFKFSYLWRAIEMMMMTITQGHKKAYKIFSCYISSMRWSAKIPSLSVRMLRKATMNKLCQRNLALANELSALIRASSTTEGLLKIIASSAPRESQKVWICLLCLIKSSLSCIATH